MAVNLPPLVTLLRAPLADGGLALSASEAVLTKHELLRFLALKVRARRARERTSAPGP